MNKKNEMFLSDYLNLSNDELVGKYKKYEIDIPAIDEFLQYLMANNKLNLMIDKPEDISKGKRVFLVEIEPNKEYKVYSLYRNDMEINEEFFDSISNAVSEKLDRVIGGLQASRR